MLPDAAPVEGPVSTVAWTASTTTTRPVPAHVRRIGLVAGLAVGGVLDVVGSLTTISMSTIPSWPTFVPAVLVAGGLGGWLMAETAWRARSRAAGLGTIVALGVLAVLIGDLTVALITLAGAALGVLGATAPAAGLTVLTWIGGFVELLLAGLFIVGPFALPFTLGGAAIWAVVLWLVRWRVEPGGPAPA